MTRARINRIAAVGISAEIVGFRQNEARARHPSWFLPLIDRSRIHYLWIRTFDRTHSPSTSAAAPSPSRAPSLPLSAGEAAQVRARVHRRSCRRDDRHMGGDDLVSAVKNIHAQGDVGSGQERVGLFHVGGPITAGRGANSTIRPARMRCPWWEASRTTARSSLMKR